MLRQLMVDLVTFPLIKTEWHSSELAVLQDAVKALKVDEQSRDALLTAFDLLRKVGASL